LIRKIAQSIRVLVASPLSNRPKTGLARAEAGLAPRWNCGDSGSTNSIAGNIASGTTPPT
jgi:hypothetical protein